MHKNIAANPRIIFKEGVDGWAILFDPETNEAYNINPIGISIWKILDGQHTQADILRIIGEDYADIPEAAGFQVSGFVAELIKNGLAGYEVINSNIKRGKYEEQERKKTGS